MATSRRRRRRQQLPRTARTTPPPQHPQLVRPPAPTEPAEPAEPTATEPAATERLLLDVATRVWLARQHAARAATPSRPLVRELDLALAALATGGVVVQGHDGSGFDPGLSLVVVAYQPMPGLAREEVVETVRPSVYLGGRQVRRGEVVVGVPDRAAGATEPTELAQPTQPTEPAELAELAELAEPDHDAPGAAR